MEYQVARLVEKAWTEFQKCPPDHRFCKWLSRNPNLIRNVDTTGWDEMRALP
jgi:hypothetical protein